jgi:hypothetical protein
MPIMWTSNCSWLKFSFLSAGLLAACVFAKPIQAQQGPPVRVGGTTLTGYPEDWSHRHVVFSNVETEAEALGKGDHERWQKVVNDPRYVIQQLKNRGDVKGPSWTDADYRSRWILQSGFSRSNKKQKSNIERDWSEALGGSGLAAGQYPAKYNVTTTTPSCSDYVVFPTGATGAANQATIVAFNSVYSGCPLYSSDPVVYWAYNTGTGFKATTSPVLSLDGSQVAFVQSNGTTASVVLLKMAASGGSVSAPAAATSQTLANYRGCSAPCYTAISLGATTNDTNSAPFYVYEGADKLYVGDNAGKVHEVTGAFLGTPALDGTTGWPVTASTETAPALYSPVYDAGASNRIFVTDAGGFLHSFAATAPPGAVGVSGRLENNTSNVFEAPVVDSSTELVYTFVGYGGDTGNPSHVNRFPAATALAGGFGTSVTLGNGSATTNPATSHMQAGAFDNQYYTGAGTTGNMYVCENGRMYQIPMSTFTTVNVYNTPVSAIGVTAACSPVTEFLGVKVATTLSAAITTTTATAASVTSGTGIVNNDYIQIGSEIMKVTAGGGTGTLTVTRGQLGTTAATHLTGTATQDIQDWLFASVAGSGNTGGCTGACIFNYNVIGAGTTGTPTTGLAAAGGTSGIVIDTSSTAITGDEEIYYTLLGGTSAIQASQAGLQ